MAASSDYNNNLKLLYDDYLPHIFFVPRKKKYTAYLINKDGSLKTDVNKKILCIKNDNNNFITTSNKL